MSEMIFRFEGDDAEDCARSLEEWLTEAGDLTRASVTLGAPTLPDGRMGNVPDAVHVLALSAPLINAVITRLGGWLQDRSRLRAVTVNVTCGDGCSYTATAPTPAHVPSIVAQLQRACVT
ncbi:hypothetical protein JHN45_07285 [Streptomyces sp. MBT53]|nr:hypothetical protein [Streptomyces sp. MBT53]